MVACCRVQRIRRKDDRAVEPIANSINFFPAGTSKRVVFQFFHEIFTRRLQPLLIRSDRAARETGTFVLPQ